MSAPAGLAAWHRVLANGNRPEELAEILADNAVFHSPVVHTPQIGKATVVAYLAAASQVLGGDQFRYMRELIHGQDALLEFETQIDGIHINGVDLIRFDESGKIIDFKVMIRPLKAINKVWEAMAAQLERASG